MAKFTEKFVRTELEDTCVTLPWEELAVENNDVQTFNNVAMHLLAVGKAIDTAYIFEAKFPGKVAEILEGYTNDWEALRAELAEKYPAEYIVWARLFSIVPASEDIEDIAALAEGEEAPVKKSKSKKEVKEEEIVEDDEEISDEIEDDEEIIEDDEEEEELEDEDDELEEIDEIIDEEFEDEVVEEEDKKESKKGAKKGSKKRK